MSAVIAHDGTVVTPAMLDDWFEQAEAGELPGEPGPTRRGRPLSIGEEAATPVTVRLDMERRRKLELMAEMRHVSQAQVMRDLLDHAAS
jgi:predicted transcriptional regulator